MNGLTIIILICSIVVIGLVVLSNLRNNRGTINSLRRNNRESENINRETSEIVTGLERENREARELNESIREDNKRAADIIADVRKQKLD